MILRPLNTFEATENDYATAVDTAPVSLGTALKNISKQNLDFNPTASLFRLKEKSEAYDVSDNVINKDELNTKYADLGLFFEKDTREGVVNYIVERKKKERKRSNIISRGPQNFGAKAAYLTTGLITSFADPINIAASFVPVVGQAKFASMLAKSGKNVARLKKGFTEATVGNIAVEPIVYGVAQSEQADYDYLDSFNNIAIGSVLGAGLHVGFGKIGDQIAKARGKPNVYQRLAKANPEVREQLLARAVGRVIKDQPVDVAERLNVSRFNDDALDGIDARKQNLEQKISQLKSQNKKQNKAELKTLYQELKDLKKQEKNIINEQVNKNKSKIIKDFENKDDNIDIDTTASPKKIINKNVTDLENEAENLSQTAKQLERQLNNKAVSDELFENFDEINKIDNRIQKKQDIQAAIKAGANCLIRRT